MKKTLTKAALLSMVVLGMAFVSCTNKTQVKEQPSDEPSPVADTALVAAADNHLKMHQEDILALWESTIGEDKTFARYALAKDYVFLSTENGKEGLLLSFYKDMKDVDNFDGIPLCEGQELLFQGDALLVKEKTDEGDKTIYYEKTESEGFNELFTVTEKDGKKTFTDDLGEPYDEKEAQGFIDKFGNAEVSPLTDVLGESHSL